LTEGDTEHEPVLITMIVTTDHRRQIASTSAPPMTRQGDPAWEQA
jgi:hypothetical protein